MDTLLPDFNQATFESGQPIDNQYFPLTPGTVLSYQGELYDTEEIVEEVTEEIGEEIAEEITEEFAENENGEDEDDDDDELEDDDLDELADEIESEIEDLIDEAVEDVVEELGDEIGDFDSEELAEEIAEELTEDVLEALTGKEIELDEDEDIDDFGDEIGEYELDIPLNIESLEQIKNHPNSIRSFAKPVNSLENEALIGYVRVSESLTELQNTLRRLDYGLGSGIAIALLASGFGSVWLTDRAMQPIESSFEKLRQFTADASHELRSPLMAIKTNADVALKYSNGMRDTDAEKFSATITLSGLWLIFLASFLKSS